MISLDELAQLRFGMSGLPQPGGSPGDYEEKLSQWFLERSFFRDFTYRNPRGKKKGDGLGHRSHLEGPQAGQIDPRRPQVWGHQEAEE